MNIKEVAQEAGVSVATISRVLNGSEKVNPKTRQKVVGFLYSALHLEIGAKLGRG